eukprot:m.271078 g.271078  ORF g.271078 m.271078 type:complete len:239 (+) comp15682_c0_seq45:1522-2238(+)
MQPNAIIAICSGVGFAWVFNFQPIRKALGRQRNVTASALALLLLSAQLGANYQSRDESDNVAVMEFGYDIVNGLPPDAILLTLGDLPGNSARYLHHCEGVRSDLRIIDLEMMTFDWYVPMLKDKFPGVKFPGDRYSLEQGGFAMKQFFDENYDNFPIFVFQHVNPQDTTWQADYDVWHYGLTHKVVRKDYVLNVQEWFNNATAALPYVSTAVSHLILLPSRAPTRSRLDRQQGDTHTL